jgi:potassium-transporting ATPase KdpC subunit
MTKTLVADFRTAIISMVFFTVLCGAAYPLFMTGVAQAAFPAKANGSIVEKDGQPVGSALVGQTFTGAKYFHSRPSTDDYSGFSGGSNYGPSSAELIARVEADLARIREENGLTADAAVPVDAVTASASGLDPHISPAYAELQIARVSRERGLTEDEVRGLVKQHTDDRTLLVMGEPRVNVLELNLALDAQ